MSPTNADRADSALDAVEYFGLRACPNEDLVTKAADLVTNILHLVRRECEIENLDRWLQFRLQTHDQEVEEDVEE